MKEFNRSASPSRGGEGRGEGSRESSSLLRSSFRDTGAVWIPLSTAAKVHRAADLTRERAERHYEKHRTYWISKAYTRLLLKSMPTLALTPPGVISDPKAQLYARATREVAQKQARRLASIDDTRRALLGTGKLRASRDLDWGEKAKAAPGRVGERQPAAPTARVASRDERAVNAKIATAQDRVRRKAEAHLVKHQEEWTGKRYDQLTALFGTTTGKAPKWAAQHVRDVAMEVANREVKAKHETRLQRIDQAADRMRASGQVRASRPMGRNVAIER